MSLLALAALAMLGLVWLSIAAAGWLSAVMPPPLAAALTGGTLFAIAAIALLMNRAKQAEAKAKRSAQAAASPKTDDLISRATRIAEGMAPESPVAALTFALLAGVASVTLPPTLNPFLGNLLDDVEKAAGAHKSN